MIRALLCAAALLLAGVPAFAQQVTPRACTTTTVTTGGTAVTAISGPDNGFYIINPLTAADEGIGTAEALWIDVTGANAIAGGYTTTISLAPGNTFSPAIGQATVNVTVNATTSGHRFACVRW